MKDKIEVTNGVKECVKWWINQRQSKLEHELSESMSVNPFLFPFLFDFHNLENFDNLAELVIASHLMIGHGTGFGKLIDEKILPQVFGTEKLSKKFRKSTMPYLESAFNEVDHLIIRENGKRELLSLKAGKWTIQLTMAKQLNSAFNEILTRFPELCDKIIVGVFYGKDENLTDKYDILRGINRGANHDVIDIQKHIGVLSGRDFWKWLNDGQDMTQEWVLEGIMKALEETDAKSNAKKLLDKFKHSVVKKYEPTLKEEDGSLNWFKFLKSING